MSGSAFQVFDAGQLASYTHFARSLAIWGVGAKSSQALALFEVSLAASGEAQRLQALLEGHRLATDTTVRKRYFWKTVAWIRSHPHQIKRALKAMRRRYVAGAKRFDGTQNLADSLRLILAPKSGDTTLNSELSVVSPDFAVSRHRYFLAGPTGDIVDSDASGDGVKGFARSAKALRKARRFQEAIPLLQEGLRRYPNNVRLLCSMAEVYGRMGDDRQALEWFHQALTQAPDNVETLTALGQLYYRMGRLDEALKTLQRAIEIDPKYAPPHQALGYLYLKLRRVENAMAAFAKARELQSENGGQVSEAVQRGEEEALNRQALCLRNQGRRAEEAEILQQLVERFPKDVKLLCRAGAAFRKTGRYEQALHYYKKAFALESQNQIVLSIIGRIYLEMGREEEALQAFQQAHDLNPNDAVVLTEIGGIYLRRERYEEALVFHQRAVALNPSDVIALTNVGKTYQKMGDLDNALVFYERALGLSPRDFILLTDIGKIYIMKEQPEKALDFFQRARSRVPEDKFILTGIGEAYLMMGRLDEAANFLQRVLRASPEDRVAQNLLGRVMRRRGE